MNAKLAMLALVALAACSYVQAAVLPTTPLHGYEDQYELEPDYEAGTKQRQASKQQRAYPGEQQYLDEQQYQGLPVPVAPHVYQAQQAQQAGKHRGQFRAHLRELGKAGLTSGRRALADARPALNNLRGDLSDAANRVASNPKVSKFVQAAKPRVDNVRARAQPLVEKSTKRIGDLAARAQQRIANRGQQQQQQGLAPVQYAPVAGAYEHADEVYPMPPPSYQ